MKFITKIFLIIALVISFLGCHKDYSEQTQIASFNGGIETTIMSYGYDYIVLSYNFNLYGAYDKFGICYSEQNAQPTVNDKVYFCDQPNGSIKFSGLKEGTTYNFREFIQKDDVVSYKDDVKKRTTLTKATMTKVRFKKAAGSSANRMRVYNTNNYTTFAEYYFGSSSRTSDYYDIPAGSHQPNYYNSSNKWYYPNGYYSYNFKAGRKYTLSISGYYDEFEIIDDGEY